MRISEMLKCSPDQPYKDRQCWESCTSVDRVGMVGNANDMSLESKDSKRFGILIVDDERRMVSLNRTFIEMWRLPERIVVSQNDDLALAFVAEQFEDPSCFLRQVRRVYLQKNSIIRDTIRLKDGRIFERFSQPQWLGQQMVGRLWLFCEYPHSEYLHSKGG